MWSDWSIGSFGAARGRESGSHGWCFLDGTMKAMKAMTAWCSKGRIAAAVGIPAFRRHRGCSVTARGGGRDD
jgi:hypothetical protein